MKITKCWKKLVGQAVPVERMDNAILGWGPSSDSYIVWGRKLEKRYRDGAKPGK